MITVSGIPVITPINAAGTCLLLPEDIQYHAELASGGDLEYQATPMKRQKPIDITKNKPKELTKKKRDYKNEGTQSSSNRNSGVGGLRF